MASVKVPHYRKPRYHIPQNVFASQNRTTSYDHTLTSPTTSHMGPRTREELLAAGVMDPALEAELTKNPLPPKPNTTDMKIQREHRAQILRDRQHLRPIPGPIPEVREVDRQIEMSDGEYITIRIYTHTQRPRAYGPLYVAFHEGGWSMGDLSDEETNCRAFTKEFNAVCINVDYRLAPEHPFPRPVLDCWDALKWVAENYESLGADPHAGFIIGGASAGGNIAAVLAHLARDEHLTPRLTGQFLCVPVLADPRTLPAQYKPEFLSRELCTQDPVLQFDEATQRTLGGAYKPDVESPLYTPFNDPRGGHRGLPKTYLQVCGLDPLRDEGLLYERVLREEADVKTKLDLYKGYGHMFWTNFPQLEMSKQVLKDSVEGLRWLLNDDDDDVDGLH
ncbi:alpha/beta-hydrolase [Pseudovirgaria hyperparasitica]|uniref:Alpha/beta-hydrolase n=1 Tax=Pseudovirgaria hyperparasitica TaxID=470096 RepID=A0A6A6WM79_9PEZI|nr:alpha/beta-hydrolase [Pseudovirgaria hyperparasitica]KAF2763314.1 alpha/beta-hydrolase [Pseudovirgaria hyperparasitica]